MGGEVGEYCSNNQQLWSTEMLPSSSFGGEMRVQIKVDENTTVTRKVKFVPFGNFVMNIVRYKNDEYLIGEGDEYLRGYKETYELGKRLGGGS